MPGRKSGNGVQCSADSVALAKQRLAKDAGNEQELPCDQDNSRQSQIQFGVQPSADSVALAHKRFDANALSAKRTSAPGQGLAAAPGNQCHSLDGKGTKFAVQTSADSLMLAHARLARKQPADAQPSSPSAPLETVSEQEGHQDS